MLLLSLLLVLVVITTSSALVELNRTGCDRTKVCLFKPLGCDPTLDCTIGVIMHVDEPGWIRVEMTALSIHLATIQYIAVGFSNDRKMGDDAVTECILSDRLGVVEAEVFVSFNGHANNSRIDLTTDEHSKLIKDVSGDVVDGRLVCRFAQRIVPLVDHRQIWPLNSAYYLMAATGKAQPDEVNVHDTNIHSHYYPIVSNEKIDPSSLGSAATESNMPQETNDRRTDTTDVSRVQQQQSTTPKSSRNDATNVDRRPTNAASFVSSSFLFVPLFVVLIIIG